MTARRAGELDWRTRRSPSDELSGARQRHQLRRVLFEIRFLDSLGFSGGLDLANPCLPGGKLIDVQRDDSGGGCGLRGMTEQALRSYAIISLA
jgi:hypothetical protein